ncbi:MAG: glycerol-3-phosphate acyltransferase, partial [Desulfobacterales bacterium]
DTLLAHMTAKEQNAFCRNLGYRVINAINRVAVVTPHALVASAILNNTQERFARSDLLFIIEIYMAYLATQKAKLADTLVMDQVHAVDQAIESYVHRKFIEPVTQDKDDPSSPMIYGVNDAKRPSLEYYKNNCIAFFIPAAFTALTILEKDAFQFSSVDLHAGYRFWQDFFKYEFAYDIDQTAEYHVRKTIKAFIDEAILMPHPTLPDTYNVTSAGFRKLKLFSIFVKTYLESYWIVLNFFMRTPPDSHKVKDRLKKIEARGNRMFKRREVERREALSKVSYQNAVDFFTSRGIKDAGNTEQIEFYAAALRQALKCLQA